MAAYYNEIDPYAAQWLKNLVAAGHIADGFVDNRSISDVEPYDLREFKQCHFFAGIGVWSLALRLAGWTDEREVWTGSCPCQPFSVAGRSGGFADERHLWPHWHHLIRECHPEVVFGEQVASADGLTWLDLVHSDMEGEGYAFAANDICAAGVGAPHIRQRLFFVGYSEHAGRTERRAGAGQGQTAGVRSTGVVGHHHHHQGLEGQRGGHQAESGRHGEVRSVAEASELGGVEHALHIGRQRGQEATPGHNNDGTTSERTQSEYGAGLAGSHRISQDGAGPTNGHWRDADWLFCRDGKWRPVEPGTFPLAHGATARVGRLRAYGNAIVPQVAQAFIESFLEVRP